MTENKKSQSARQRKQDLENIWKSNSENKDPSEAVKKLKLKNTNEDWNSKNKMIKRGQKKGNNKSCKKTIDSDSCFKNASRSKGCSSLLMKIIWMITSIKTILLLKIKRIKLKIQA